jgi:hypothetical protein
MNFTALVNTIKDKLPELPKPFSFINRVVSADNPERVSAVLALIAGLVLSIGFMFVVVAITKYDKKLTTEFIAINAALVSLATFTPVDRKPAQPPTTKINNPDGKETLQG